MSFIFIGRCYQGFKKALIAIKRNHMSFLLSDHQQSLLTFG